MLRYFDFFFPNFLKDLEAIEKENAILGQATNGMEFSSIGSDDGTL